MKNIAFIINPMSGTQNKRRLPKLIIELLDKCQWLENIVFSERMGHAEMLSRQYATMGFDAVVAVGGDGTVREVAQALAGTKTALGIVPMGTTNTLARHLGIPLRGNSSITWINHSEPVLCDSLSVRIDDKKQLTAMCSVAAGETRIINCAQGTKTSIQDGVAEGLTDETQRLYMNGQAVIDNDEYEVEQQIETSIAADSVYILAPKRF